MNEIIELDPNYSTTQRVRKANPSAIYVELNNAFSENAFETFVFLPEVEERLGEGGLRSHGYFKVGDVNSMLKEPSTLNRKPLITVVTVVYNGEQFLEETILSVINQTYVNVEYIIIDGGSTDGTLDIIRKYEYAIDYWVSEKDEGIYDAMNKGINLATGDWINFMNGGDTFYDEKSIQEIFIHSLEENVQVVFGKSITFFDNLEKIRYKDFNSENKIFFLKKMPNHQAVFVKHTFYKFNKFDTSYSFLADTDYLRKCFKESNFKEVETIVSRFELGGVSNFYISYKNFKNLLEESARLYGNYYLSLSKHLSKFVLQKILGKKLYLTIYIKWILR